MGDGEQSARNLPVLCVALLACVAAVGLEAYALLMPQLVYDDLTIVVASRTWERTCANLWVPANEHTMPLGRLSTWLLVQLAGSLTTLPLVTTLQGPVALVAGMGLCYLFLQRELGHPFYGLAGMVLFGVTGVYQQAVCWFAASFVRQVFPVEGRGHELITKNPGDARWRNAGTSFGRMGPREGRTYLRSFWGLGG